MAIVKNRKMGADTTTAKDRSTNDMGSGLLMSQAKIIEIPRQLNVQEREHK